MPYEALDVVRNERTTMLRSLHHPRWVRLNLSEMMETPQGKALVLEQADAYLRHVARTKPPPPAPPPPAGLRAEDGTWSFGPGKWTWTAGSSGRSGAVPGPPNPPPAPDWSEADAGPLLATHHPVVGRNNVGLRYEHLFPEIPTLE
eukprot:9482909-Alexandrium_andersonii.AAC.1